MNANVSGSGWVRFGGWLPRASTTSTNHVIRATAAIQSFPAMTPASVYTCLAIDVDAAMLTCDWIQTGDRAWQCVRCGRRIAVPVGAAAPPNFSAAPACGWKPHRVVSGEHTWYELPKTDPKMYVCSHCGLRTCEPNAASASENN